MLMVRHGGMPGRGQPEMRRGDPVVERLEMERCSHRGASTGVHDSVSIFFKSRALLPAGSRGSGGTVVGS
jgi:hypothetical protein